VEESPDFSYIIKRALEISWKYKFLWLFGIFLSFGAGFNFRFYNFGTLPSSLNTTKFKHSASNWFLAHIWLLATIGLILFLIWLAFFVMGIIAQAAVVKAADEAERGDKPTFTSMFKFGAGKFWRVLGLILFIFLIALAALVLLSIPIILSIIMAVKNPSVGLIVLTVLLVILLILLIIAFIIAIGLIFSYALRYAVIKDERIRKSVSLGWGLLRHKLSASMLLWLISVGLGMAYGFGFLMLLLLVTLPSIFFFVFLFSLGFSIIKLVLAFIAGLLILAFIMLISGIGKVYFSCYWTLSWLQLNKSLDSDT